MGSFQTFQMAKYSSPANSPLIDYNRRDFISTKQNDIITIDVDNGVTRVDIVENTGEETDKQMIEPNSEVEEDEEPIQWTATTGFQEPSKCYAPLVKKRSSLHLILMRVENTKV